MDISHTAASTNPPISHQMGTSLMAWGVRPQKSNKHGVAKDSLLLAINDMTDFVQRGIVWHLNVFIHFSHKFVVLSTDKDSNYVLMRMDAHLKEVDDRYAPDRGPLFMNIGRHIWLMHEIYGRPKPCLGSLNCKFHSHSAESSERHTNICCSPTTTNNGKFLSFG